MIQGKNPSNFNYNYDLMAVDQIFAHAKARSDIMLGHVKRTLKKRANELYEKDSLDLQKLAIEHDKMAKRELNWLLLQTKIYENPAKIREE